MNTKKITIIILACILLLSFLLKLYRFDGPIADWHSWRQADTSAVSRNFVQHGYDILHPRFDDLSNIPSGVDNPEGYRFVEFPLYNLAQAGLFDFIGFFSLEEWGRLVSIFASLLAILFIYFIVSRHSNQAIGLLSAGFYSFIPYNIYYSRTILPDTSMVMAILGGILFFDLWLSESIKPKTKKIKQRSKSIIFFLLALLFTLSAFLLKPYALFFTLPMFILAYQKWGFSFIKKWPLWLFALLAVIPLVWWRWWMMQFPEGIPANAWLLNGNGIRFRPSFFRWILYERLTVLISGYVGIIVLFFGVYKLRILKEWLFFLSFLLSSIAYTIIFATGNVQHDYYQILIMPSIAIFYGIGAYYLYKSSIVGKVVLILATVGMFWFGWQHVKDYFNINNPSIVTAGKVVDAITPKDAKVIANYTGDTSFLYQTNRKGWPSFQKSVPELAEMGADYLILANPTEQDMVFSKDYKVVAKTAQYVIFDLHKK
ncbi:MAG: hypothetical protein AAB553_05510 [Patescibacteria group bacterium]